MKRRPTMKQSIAGVLIAVAAALGLDVDLSGVMDLIHQMMKPRENYIVIPKSAELEPTPKPEPEKVEPPAPKPEPRNPNPYIAHPKIYKDGYTYKPHVLYFGADWCLPCHRIEPIVLKLRKDGYRIYGFKDAHHKDIATGIGVSVYPTFVFVRNGVIVHKAVSPTAFQLSELCKRFAL